MTTSTKFDLKTAVAGPWSSESEGPVQWNDETTGFPCMMVRNCVGSWCGYVACFEDHPFFHTTEHEDLAEVDVHGGITYTGDDMDMHYERPTGDERPMWWIGFDCAHAWDVSPMFPTMTMGATQAEYRDEAYVRAQCAQLAEAFIVKARDENPIKKLPTLGVD